MKNPAIVLVSSLQKFELDSAPAFG